MQPLLGHAPSLREVPLLPCGAPSLHRAGFRQHTSPLPRAPHSGKRRPPLCAAPQPRRAPFATCHPPTPRSSCPEPRGVSARSLPPGSRGPLGSPAQLCKRRVCVGPRRRLLARSQNKQPKATSFPGGQLSQRRPAPVAAGSGFLSQHNPTSLTRPRRAGPRNPVRSWAERCSCHWQGARVGGGMSTPGAEITCSWQ